MEKLVYLVSGPRAATVGLHAELLSTLAAHTRGLTILTPDPVLAELVWGCALFAWFPCLDRRTGFEQALSDLELGADGYLVSESVLHGADQAAAERRRARLVMLREAPQFAQAELRMGLARLSPALRREGATRITRDSVVRPLHAGAPALRALFSFVHDGATPASGLGAFAALGATAKLSFVDCERRVVRRRSR